MNPINSIEWHEENLKNWEKHILNKEEIVLKELNKIKEDKEKIIFFKYQIEEAKKQNKLTFDRDKFKVKKSIK